MKIFLNIGFFIFLINGSFNPIFSSQDINHNIKSNKLNNFYWLFSIDLKSSSNITQSIIEKWIKKNQNYNEENWHHIITANRIIFWICCSHFTIRHDDMVYRAAITNNIVKQALHLNRNLAFINNKLDKIFVLTASKGLYSVEGTCLRAAA